MKRFIFPLFFVIIVTGCNGDSKIVKSWIYDNLPQCIWNDKAYNAVNDEYKRIIDVLTDYSNEEIASYTEKTYESERAVQSLLYNGGGSMADYYDEFSDMLVGSFLGIDYGPSAERKRKAAINAYKERFDTVTDELADYLGVCLTYKDSVLVDSEHFTDYEICSSLMGTPTQNPDDSDDIVLTISRDVCMRVLSGLSHPTLSSCEYNKEKDIWVARFDNADTQYVKAFKRDDGGMDYEYSPDSTNWDL